MLSTYKVIYIYHTSISFFFISKLIICFYLFNNFSNKASFSFSMRSYKTSFSLLNSTILAIGLNAQLIIFVKNEHST